MIKITSGKYRSRAIEVPEYLEVPTKSIVRQGVNNSLRNYLQDGVVLDLFCGSGSMGLEFYSNNAKEVYFNDINKESIKCLYKNLENLKIGNAKVFNQSYEECLKHLASINVKFDVIFVDPPYKMVESYQDILRFVLNNELLSDDGIIVFEYEGNMEFDETEFQKVKKYKYGRTKVCIMWR